MSKQPSLAAPLLDTFQNSKCQPTLQDSISGPCHPIQPQCWKPPQCCTPPVSVSWYHLARASASSLGWSHFHPDTLHRPPQQKPPSCFYAGVFNLGTIDIAHSWKPVLQVSREKSKLFAMSYKIPHICPLPHSPSYLTPPPLTCSQITQFVLCAMLLPVPHPVGFIIWVSFQIPCHRPSLQVLPHPLSYCHTVFYTSMYIS